MHRSTGRLTKLLPTLSLLGVLVASTIGFIWSQGSQAEAPVFPIEVIGPDGYTRSVAVPVDDPTSVDRLWLQVHSPGYKYGGGGIESKGRYQDGSLPKMSVRLNGGEWIHVDNTIAFCEEPEINYECIGGAFATVRFTIPVDGVVSGRNTIDFRFNGTEGVTSGYRVLALNLVTASGRKLFDPERDFATENPDDWAAPYATSSAVANGEKLWLQRDRLIDSPDGPVIKASCADCHSREGYDLKYFNYSNHSIIERSKFHGLSPEEGAQIASYIRSLDFPNPGRPWNPPYQPGPGLDDKPVEEWAAGAGLEWVMETDEEVLPYLFPGPGGKPDGQVHYDAAWIRTDSVMNVREIPITIQLPDWNEWLPRVHPIDAWGADFTSSAAYRSYFDLAVQEARKLEAEGGDRASAAQIGAFGKAVEQWDSDWRDFTKGGRRSDKKGVSAYFGGYTGDDERMEQVSDRMLGLFQWQALRSWDLFHTHGLESLARRYYRDGQAEPRGWIGTSRAVFDVAPHINGPEQNSAWPHGSPLQNFFMSTAWYQLQLVINPGNKQTGGFKPVDWKYHFGHIGSLQRLSGRGEPLRLAMSYAKLLEQADNDHGVVGGGGFYMRHVEPSWFLFQRHDSKKNSWRDASSHLKARVVEAVMRPHVQKLLKHDPSEWDRGMGMDQLPPETYEPTLEPKGHITGEYADIYYRSLKHMADIGVSPTLLDSLAQWGETMWPLGDWQSLVPDAPTAAVPGARIASPSEGDRFTAPTTLVVQAQVLNGNAEDVGRVVFFANGEKIGKRTAAPFEYAWRVETPGDYTLEARLVAPSGVDTTSAPVTVSVQAPSTVSPDVARHELQLLQGWNLVASWVQPDATDITQVLAGVRDAIVMVKNERGETYIPEYDINTIGAWNPLEAYMVYVDSSAVLALEGTETDPTTSIALDEGWNLVPYLHQATKPIEDALASVREQLVIAKDYAGRSFIPAYEIDDIGAMRPGLGYKMFMEEPASLVYPSAPDGAAVHGPLLASRTAEAGASAEGTSRKGTPSSAVIVLEVPGLKDGERVVAWGETSGRIGEGVVKDGRVAVTVYGDEPATPDIVEGALEREALVLRVASQEGPTGTPLALGPLTNGLSGKPLGAELRYTPDALVLASAQLTPTEFVLEQNYPNPFKDETTITYSLPEAADVTLEVYDVLGRRVATVVDEQQKAGWYRIPFEPTSLPSGMYFYRLRAGGKKLSKEMVVVR